MESKYNLMSDEELKELAKERNKKTGHFKKTALAAQKELYLRSHWLDNDETTFDDGYTERSIVDIEYNGWKTDDSVESYVQDDV